MAMDMSGLTFGKLTREASTLARRKRRSDTRTFEREQKALVVARDGSHYCRLVPHCRERTHFETAHLENKGMGGDHGIRTHARLMLRSCFFHHQGLWSLHSTDLRVEFLTDRQADGPIEVWGRNEAGLWYLVGRETAVGVWERD